MWRAPADDLYARLGVPPDADMPTIRRAWKSKMRKLHPDGRPASEQAAAHQQAVLLNEARDVLTDPLKRADYDLSRRAQPRNRDRPEAPPTPPPAPPRVVLEPSVVDFGTIRLGAMPGPQMVTIRLSDGATMGRVAVLHHWGGWWANEQYTESTNCKTFSAWFDARPVTNLPLGDHEEVAEIVVDGQHLLVRLRIRVEQAEPTGPPAPEGSPPLPQSAPVHGIPRPRWLIRVSISPRLLALLLMLALLIGGGAWATTNMLGKSGHPAASATPKPSPYCEVTSDQGVMAFFRVVPGTEHATGPELWDSMASSASDLWVTWWTPQFQYWERANRTTGYKDGTGATYGQYADLQVSIIWEQGWEPLSGMIERHPQVNGEAEAKMRNRFLGEWIKYLSSPTCAQA